MQRTEFLEIILSLTNNTSVSKQAITIGNYPDSLKHVLPSSNIISIIGSYETGNINADNITTIIFRNIYDESISISRQLLDLGWIEFLPQARIESRKTIMNSNYISPILLNHNEKLLLRINTGSSDEDHSFWQIEGSMSYSRYLEIKNRA